MKRRINTTRNELSRTGDFSFYADYAEHLMKKQPEMYGQMKRIVDVEVETFLKKHRRPPRILDVGAAGLVPYDTSRAQELVMLDLFPKPKEVSLKANWQWVTCSILDSRVKQALKGRKFDIIIMGSLLHHLADENNHSKRNVRLCLENCAKLLSHNGFLLIFESTVPPFLARVQDVFYPVYSKILKDILKFTYVRILSDKELERALKQNNFVVKRLRFNQPKHVSLVFWKIPKRFAPFRARALRAYLA